MNDTERELGRLAGEVTAIGQRMDRFDSKLDQHITDEEKTLKRIQEQLSLSRFLWLTVKAVVITIAFLLAFKFGDIANLWKALR
jgi:hypothetical protein